MNQLTETEVGRIITELQNLEALGKQVQQRSYNTRKLLERFYAPAPQGKTRKGGITDQEVSEAIIKMRERQMKKRA